MHSANKGSAYYRLGQYTEALKWLDKALKLNQSLLVSIYYKTRSLEELGEPQIAAEYFKNASNIYYHTIMNMSNAFDQNKTESKN